MLIKYVFDCLKLYESMSVKDWKMKYLSDIPKEEKEQVNTSLQWYRAAENEDVRKEFPLETFSSTKQFAKAMEWLKNKKAYIALTTDKSRCEKVFENETIAIFCPLNPSAAHQAAHFFYTPKEEEKFELTGKAKSKIAKDTITYKHNVGLKKNVSPTWCIAASDKASTYWKDYRLYENHLLYFIFFKPKNYQGLRYALVLNANAFHDFYNRGVDIGKEDIIQEFRDPEQHRGHEHPDNELYKKDYKYFLSEIGMTDKNFSQIIRNFCKETKSSTHLPEIPDTPNSTEEWKENLKNVIKSPDDKKLLKEFIDDYGFFLNSVKDFNNQSHYDADEEILLEDDVDKIIERILGNNGLYSNFIKKCQTLDKLILNTFDIFLSSKNKITLKGCEEMMCRLFYETDDNVGDKVAQALPKVCKKLGENLLSDKLFNYRYFQDDEKEKEWVSLYAFYFLKKLIITDRKTTSTYLFIDLVKKLNKNKKYVNALIEELVDNYGNEYEIPFLYLLNNCGYKNGGLNFFNYLKNKKPLVLQHLIKYIIGNINEIPNNFYEYVANAAIENAIDLEDIFTSEASLNEFKAMWMAGVSAQAIKDYKEWFECFMTDLFLERKSVDYNKQNPKEVFKVVQKYYNDVGEQDIILIYLAKYMFSKLDYFNETPINSEEAAQHFLNHKPIDFPVFITRVMAIVARKYYYLKPKEELMELGKETYKNNRTYFINLIGGDDKQKQKRIAEWLDKTYDYKGS